MRSCLSLSLPASWISAFILLGACTYVEGAAGQREAGGSDVRAPSALTRVVAPILLDHPVAELPEAAALGAERHSVGLILLVDQEGRVRGVEVSRSAGPLLDQAAAAAAWKARFRPARRDGVSTSAKIGFEWRFVEAPEAPVEKLPSKKESSSSTASSPVVSQPVTEEEEEVIVTGSRIPEPARSAVVGTEVIRRQELEDMGAQSLEDALLARGGVQVERSFRGTELWVRGLDPEYTLILLNGQRVPGRIGGAIDLNRYPIERIERVEIVRGPSSALYGSEAIGGVVNIITRENHEPLTADAEARVGTNQAHAGNARVAGRPVEWLGLDGGVGRQFTDSFQLDEAEGEATSGSSRRADSYFAGLTIGKSRRHQVSLRTDHSLVELNGVDAGAGAAVFDRTQIQEQRSIQVVHDIARGDWLLNTAVTYSTFREQYLLDQRESEALDDYTDQREKLGQLSTTADYSWSDAHRTTVGAEGLLQRLQSPRLVNEGSRTRYAVFAQHRWNLGDPEGHRLSVVPGLRLDVDSQFGDQVSPKIALRYDPFQRLTFRASYGRGFRAPNFQQLLLRFENPTVGYVVNGNPDLGAERSHGFDVAAEYRPVEEVFFLVAGFRNDLTGMIATITAEEGAGGTVFSYDNLTSARTQGVETQVVASWGKWLSGTAGYTLTDTWDGQNERRIEGQAPHLVFLRARLAEVTSDLFLVARASARLGRPYYQEGDSGEEELVRADPLFEADLRLAKNFGDSFQMFAGVDNLLQAGDRFSSLLPRQFYGGLRGHY